MRVDDGGFEYEIFGRVFGKFWFKKNIGDGSEVTCEGCFGFFCG